MKRSAESYQELSQQSGRTDLSVGALCMEAISPKEDTILPMEDQRVATFIETSERYRARLLSAARRLAPTAEDAEDMVQDALVKAYRKLSQFRNESRMETWLYRITQNAAHEYMRRQKNRNDVSLDQNWNEDDTRPALNIADPRMDPEEHCCTRELQAIMHKRLSSLGPKCRQAIVLCILEEIPQREAASRVGVRPATIKAS
jgi:RNA polymerase sigma-70 factor (ECF subfamily)